MSELIFVEKGNNDSSLGKLNLWWGKIAFQKKLPEFYRQLHGALAGGKSSQDTLSDMSTQARLRRDQSYLVYEAVLVRLKKGEPLYKALQGFVGQVDKALLAPAAANDIALSKALAIAEKVAVSREKMTRIGFNKVLGPLAQLFTLLSMALFMGGSIFPDILASAKDTGQTAKSNTAELMIQISKWILDNQIIMSFIVVSFFIFAYGSRQTLKNSSLRKILDKIPPWSFFHIRSGANFVVSLSALIETGSSADEAFEALSISSKPYLKSHLDEMKKRIEAGEIFSKAINTGLLPAEIVDEIAIRGRPENLQGVLRQLGLERIEELEETLGRAFTRWARLFSAISYIVLIFSVLAFVDIYQIAGSAPTH
ncbi:type II secretion system F family protein [Chromobacterium vaccinii]|uniref:type II secretion system F family protein n=1 Tax=Chromobacterium vaccinii TaxID=1108595 RepID=UPI003458E836